MPEIDVIDTMSDRPVRCEIEVLPSGAVTMLRSPGCTEADAVDMCRAIGGGWVRVRDMTLGAAGPLRTSDRRGGANSD